MSDASRVTRSIDAAGDIDVFRIDVRAGQRYAFEIFCAQSFFSGDGAGYALHLIDEAGKEWFFGGGGARADADNARTMGYAPEADGTIFLRLAGTANHGAPLNYAIQAVAVPPDDHGDTLAAATALALGAVRRGVFERPQDSDLFAVDLAAGQRVLFEVDGAPPGTSPASFSYRAKLFDPGGAEVPYYVTARNADLQLAFTAPAAGRYVLDLLATSSTGTLGGPSVGSYDLRASLLPADDHADLRTAATQLALGQALPLRVDHAGDLDWFRIGLTAGDRVAFALGPTAGAPAGASDAVTLALYDAAGQLLREGYGAGLVFEAQQAGTYLLAARSGELAQRWPGAAADFTLAAGLAPVDDVGGEHWNAARLVFGTPTAGTHLGAGDDDVFRFDAVAGRRYEFVIDNGGGDAMSRYAFEPQNTPPAEHMFIDPGQLLSYGAAQRVVYFAAADGPVFLRLAAPFWTGATAALPYTLGAAVLAADDHGETRATATPLRSGESAGATLEPGESDFFRVELQAGLRYAFSMVPDDHAVVSAIEIFDALHPGSLVNEFDTRSIVFVPETGGSYYVRASVSAWTRAQLSYRLLPSDDTGDSTLSATRLEPASSLDVTGLAIVGRSGDEQIAGSTRNDTIDGGAGDDWIRGGGGADRIEGGAGADTLRLGGTSAASQWHRQSDGTWRVSGAAADGTLTLSGVERLSFDGQSQRIALDLDGHAGQVARVLGALLGKPALQDGRLVGLGLALLDGGMSYADLVAAAVASSLFEAAAGSHGDADFVRLVYRNLTGAPADDAALALYTGLLRSGAQTQASLALLACDSDLAAAQIGLAGLADSGLVFTPWSG